MSALRRLTVCQYDLLVTDPIQANVPVVAVYKQRPAEVSGSAMTRLAPAVLLGLSQSQHRRVVRD